MLSRTFTCRFIRNDEKNHQGVIVSRGMMRSSMQIGLRERRLACGGLKRGCLLLAESKNHPELAAMLHKQGGGSARQDFDALVTTPGVFVRARRPYSSPAELLPG